MFREQNIELGQLVLLLIPTAYVFRNALLELRRVHTVVGVCCHLGLCMHQLVARDRKC